MIWLIATLGCSGGGGSEPQPPRPVVAGAPVVGAAEGYLDLPVGTPLAGYSSRCLCLGGSLFQPDDRDSAYTESFIESTGVQTWPGLKVIWIENGDEHLVLAKADTIYSDDGIVAALTEALEAETGLELKGKVVLSTNHSHSSFGSFAQGLSWYLGSDRFNREIFERFVESLVDVALEAYDSREAGKIGVGWATDWDPGDEVYRDRRSENDELKIWGPGSPALGKDPHLGMIRFDRLDGSPLALIMNFGMHGILGDIDNPMASGDSGGHLEAVVQEAFDTPVVVMFTQGSGGDASPAGTQDGFAKMESVGVAAVDKVMALYDTITTSEQPLALQTASRHIYKHPSIIEITRGGTVDWRYAPYEPGRISDGEVYDASGALISPIDEFNTPNGGVFCGTGDLSFLGTGFGATAFPYDQCVDVGVMAGLLDTFFNLDEPSPVPLPELLKAGTTATRLGPVPTLLPDGTRVEQDLLVGFFPGEPVYSFGEQWRRRVEAELGYTQPMLFGYSQDHEGYMLVPEDWLMGGYEPDITFWGPLEAEYVMEQVIGYAGELLSTDVHEDPDPLGHYAPTEYPETPLPTIQPDATPDAGQRITDERTYLWTPFIAVGVDGQPQAPTEADLLVPAAVPRVQGMVQIAWEGGDPMVDSPKVVLERELEGAWVPVLSRSGRVIDEGRHDILLAHTPTPLAPVDAVQTHQWWAAWQAVGHVHQRTSLPLGRYRLRVTGERYTGAASTWPWDTEPYEVISEPFELVPAAITIDEQAHGQGTLRLSLDAAVDGFRFVAIGGNAGGANPVEGPLQVIVEALSGDQVLQLDPSALDVGGLDEATRDALGGSSVIDVALPPDATAVQVTDPHGNTGRYEL